MSVADEIKAKLDIVAYIQQYVPLKKAGRSYKACCPWHAERTPSFVVDPERQSFRCFGACATGGDIFAFAMRQHGWSFNEALQELGKQAGVEVRPQTPEQRAQNERLDGLRGLMQTAAEAYHNALLNVNSPEAAATLQYAREKRGLTEDTIRRFQIGYALPGWQNLLEHLKAIGYDEEQIIEVGLAARNDETGRVYDRFRNRLMIPIRDERGRVIGFGARALDPEDNPKYLNSPQTPLFDKSRTLFGFDLAKGPIRDSETAVIVEGYMDAIQAHQAGFTNVVAQMGTAITEMQLKLLARTAKRIILALDSDAAGQNATRRSLEVAYGILKADYTGKLSVDIRVLQIPGAKDPDDLIRESPNSWAQSVENAKPVTDFVIDFETAVLPTEASLQEREEVARRLLPFLLTSKDNLYTKDNIQKLALKLRIAERSLAYWADEQRKILEAKPPRRPSASRLEGGVKVIDLEPPDFPPLDDDRVIPLDEDSSAPIIPQRRPPTSHQAELERYCLRMLFRQPDLFYNVNRKLRELAGNSRALRDGPLCDWSGDDFTESSYRALMEVFKQGLEQDDRDLMDFVRVNLEETLQMELETIMIGDLEDVRARVRNTQPADLVICWNYNQRVNATLDIQAEVIDKALRLRIQRLQREREELHFLQLDAEANGNDILYGHQVTLSIQAKKLIDAELKISALRG